MSQIIFSGGSKGGVGKSLLAASLGDFLIETDTPFTLIEADRTNPDVYRFFAAEDNDGNVTIKDSGKDVEAHLVDLQTRAGWDSFIRLLEKEVREGKTNRTYVVDLPGGIDEAFTTEIERFGSAMKELKIDLKIIWTINRTPDSVSTLQDALPYIKEYFSKLYVVKNLFWGEENKFKRFDNSKTAKTVKEIKGSVLVFPEMPDELMDAVWIMEARRFSAQSNLDIVNRMDMQTFLKKSRAMLQEIATGKVESLSQNGTTKPVPTKS